MTSWVHRAVKARRNHRCLWCKERIHKGTLYVLEEYADGSEHGRNRYHPECRAAVQRMDRDEVDWWNDEGCIPEYIRGGTVLKEHAEKEA